MQKQKGDRPVNRGSRRAGMTLLEIMLTMAAFTVIMTAASLFTTKSESVSEVREAAARAEMDARTLVDQMVVELRQSGTSGPDWAISTAGDSITFNKAIGFDGDAIVWSPPITYSLTPALLFGESTNGSDDNGNTIVDESFLMRVEDQTASPAWTNYQPGPASRTFGSLIAAGNLQFSLNERLLTITLTVSTWDDLARMRIDAPQTASVALRNP